MKTDDNALSHDADPAPIENANDEPVSDSENIDAVESVETDGLAGAVDTAVESAISQWVGFDPSIHATNPDGTPKLRGNGSYALKRGRKKGSTFSVSENNPGNADVVDHPAQAQAPITSAPQAAAATLNNAQTALFLVSTVTGVLSRAIGPEWAAEKNETKGLTDATKAYLDATGGITLSPGIALSLAIASYAAPRFAHENTRSRFGRIYDWCRDRVAVIRSRMGV